MDVKQKVYPSASAFMDGKMCNTQYSSGCHRMILAKACGLKSNIPEKFMIMGELNELRFYRKLVDSGKYSVILDEISIKTPTGIGSVVYSGRTDFLTLKSDSDTWEVHENKSSMSSSTLGAAKRGEVKLNQLAQLVSYMVMHSLPVGYLHIDGYSEKKIKGTDEVEIVPKIRRDTKLPHSYTFVVSLSENRDILVNGRLTGFTTIDYVNHLKTTAEMLNKPYIADRPMSAEDERGCCSWCEMKYVCDKADQDNLTVDEFINEALLINKGE